MKKVLLGLLVLSALSYTATVDLNSAFDKGGSGEVKITATLTSTIPQPKYVVFTSTDGNSLVGAEDTLVLPSFVMTTDPSTTGFDGIPNSIYVKKISFNGGTLENLTNETMTITPVFDPIYTYVSSAISVPSQTYLQPFLFLSAAEVNRIATTAFPDATSASVVNNGQIKLVRADGNTVYFRAVHRILMDAKLGQIDFSSADAKITFGQNGVMEKDEAEKVLAELRSGLTNTVALKITIN